MYDRLFCRLYNEFGWNEYPLALSEQLIRWLELNRVSVRSALDLGCGTGVLCQQLHAHGIETVGMDLSPDMIAIARERAPELRFEVADMTRFQTDRIFDLVTCTGDAINHIEPISSVERVFSNVYDALAPGGLFIFDLLDEGEIPLGEPFEADAEDGLRVRIGADMDDTGRVTLRIEGRENDVLRFSETIVERLYDPGQILSRLESAGFSVLQCSNALIQGENTGTTWFVVAQKAKSENNTKASEDSL